MTKERKLAIQMWYNIKNKIIYYSYFSDRSIWYYKEEFCKEHNLKWLNHCWFCQYMPKCEYCPLRNCSHSSVYHIICTSQADKEIRLEACDIIIAALEGRCAVK